MIGQLFPFTGLATVCKAELLLMILLASVMLTIMGGFVPLKEGISYWYSQSPSVGSE